MFGAILSDEQKIHEAVVENLVEHRMPRRVRQPVGVDRDRQNAGVGKSELLELLAVVLRVAEREIGGRRQSRELLARDRRQPEQRRRVRREESRRA